MAYVSLFTRTKTVLQDEISVTGGYFPCNQYSVYTKRTKIALEICCGTSETERAKHDQERVKVEYFTSLNNGN